MILIWRNDIYSGSDAQAYTAHFSFKVTYKKGGKEVHFTLLLSFLLFKTQNVVFSLLEIVCAVDE